MRKTVGAVGVAWTCIKAEHAGLEAVDAGLVIVHVIAFYLEHCRFWIASDKGAHEVGPPDEHHGAALAVRHHAKAHACFAQSRVGAFHSELDLFACRLRHDRLAARTRAHLVVAHDVEHSRRFHAHKHRRALLGDALFKEGFNSAVRKRLHGNSLKVIYA